MKMSMDLAAALLTAKSVLAQSDSDVFADLPVEYAACHRALSILSGEISRTYMSSGSIELEVNDGSFDCCSTT